MNVIITTNSGVMRGSEVVIPSGTRFVVVRAMDGSILLKEVKE